MNRQILKEEEEKAKIQKDLSILTDRLSKINESLARKVQARNEYDRTVQETEVRERESERETTKTATRKKSLYQQRPFREAKPTPNPSVHLRNVYQSLRCRCCSFK